jgi:quercetin dioxygenase-like cupin family protein
VKFPARRVVTGHDESGKAIVLIDETATNVRSRRGGHASHVVWSEPYPVDNDATSDGSQRQFDRVLPNGSVFRVIRLEPGAEPRMHRTNSLDYAIVLAGEVDLELDDSVVRLKAGDTVVQRGTIHNWANRGGEVCLIGIVLISADPANAGGRVLDEIK